MKFRITTCGYAMEDKIVGKGTKTASVLYVPKDWEGKKVRIILEEPLDE